jgi:hypothetical protein
MYRGGNWCFCFLYFVGIKYICIYGLISLWLEYIYIVTSSISYRLVDLVWINRMHNKWMKKIKTIHTDSMPTYFLKKYDRYSWTQLRIQASGGLLWTLLCSFRSHKIHGISCLFLWHKVFAGQSKKSFDLTEFSGL